MYEKRGNCFDVNSTNDREQFRENRVPFGGFLKVEFA